MLKTYRFSLKHFPLQFHNDDIMVLDNDDDPDANEEFAEKPVIEETVQDDVDSQSLGENEYVIPETQFEDLTETQLPPGHPKLAPNVEEPKTLPSVISGSCEQHTESLVDRIMSSATTPNIKTTPSIDLFRLRNRVYANKDDIGHLKDAIKDLQNYFNAMVSEKVQDSVKFIESLPLKSHSEVLQFFADKEKVRELTSFAVATIHSGDGTTLREVIDRLLHPRCTFLYVWPGDK